MSFGTFARKVRDADAPYGRRVSALGSCVQLYRPIGFQVTFSFLRAQAGPYRHDDVALLHALEILESSRAAWHAELRVYAAARQAEKRLGHRSPRPSEPNPYRPVHWYGAPREGALHALRFWRQRRLPALLLPPDLVAWDLDRCVTACLESGGGLTPDQRHLLAECVDRLRQRVTPGTWRDDRPDYHRALDLLTVARHVETAAGTA